MLGEKLIKEKITGLSNLLQPSYAHKIFIVLLSFGMAYYLYLGVDKFITAEFWIVFLTFLLILFFLYKKNKLAINIFSKVLVFLAILTPILYGLIDFKYQRNYVNTPTPTAFRAELIANFSFFEIYILLLFFLITRFSKRDQQLPEVLLPHKHSSEQRQSDSHEL